jgi:hypothetical protein
LNSLIWYGKNERIQKLCFAILLHLTQKHISQGVCLPMIARFYFYLLTTCVGNIAIANDAMFQNNES